MAFFISIVSALTLSSGRLPGGHAGVGHVAWLLGLSLAAWLAASMQGFWPFQPQGGQAREDAETIARIKAGDYSARFEASGSQELTNFYQELNSLLDSLTGAVQVHRNILSNCAGCAAVTVDADGTVLAWNKGTAVMLGLADEEIKGQSLWKFLEGGEGKWRKAVEWCATAGRGVFDARVLKKDAAAVQVEMALHAQRDPSGRITGYVALFSDTAPSSKKEADLAQYAEKLRSLVESRSDEVLKKNSELERTNLNMARLQDQMERQNEQLKVAHGFLDNILHTVPTGVMTVDTERVITSFNKAAEDITGFRAAEVIGQKCAVLRGDPCLKKCGLLSDESDGHLKGAKCAIQTRQGKSVKIIKNASHLKDSNGRIIGAVESFIDITQLDETERKYRETDARLQKILDCAVDVAIVTTDIEGIVTSFNQGAQRLSGWDASEAIGRKAREVLYMPAGEETERAHVIERARKEGRFEGYVNFRHKNGKMMRCFLSLMPLTDSDDKHYGYVAVSRAESAGKDFVSPVEKISHEIVMTMPEPCLMLDDNGVVSCANEAAARILRAETGKEWKPQFDAADEWWSGEALSRMLKGGEAQPAAFEAMVGHRSYEITLTPVTDPDAAGALIVTGRDVTESALMRRQLVQQDRMVTVGMLTAGVAHEFNNLLGGIIGYASIAKTDPAYREKLVEVVQTQGGKAVEMAQGLLNYSRKNMKGGEFADIRTVADEVLNLVARDMEKHGIQMERKYENVPKTRMNVGQMEQVLLNLIVNARQAMENGGTLTVAARRERDNLLIAVTDTGCGIKHEDRHKIFQPFYTTKRFRDGKQEGTGLGLSVASNIIKQHRGSIRVASELGKGSTFTVALPIIDENRAMEPLARADGGQAVTRAARPRRILVVDDEAILRSLYNEILAAAGHEVTCVDSGRKAAELVEAGEFEILFLDITLGGEWDGIETFKKIREKNNRIKVILSTGSVEHAHIQPYIDQADAFLQKPFTMNDLLPLVESL